MTGRAIFIAIEDDVLLFLEGLCLENPSRFINEVLRQECKRRQDLEVCMDEVLMESIPAAG